MDTDKFDKLYKKIDLFIKAIGLAGIVFTFLNFSAYKDKIYEDNKRVYESNEKARRETSLNLLLNVQDKFGMGLGLYCASFLSNISENELKKLTLFDEIDFDNKYRETLNRCLAGQSDLLKPSRKKNQLTLTRLGSYQVFYRATHDLNLLETLALAHNSLIVDNDMIDNTFGTQLKAKQVESFICKLRSVGAGSYVFLETYLLDQKKHPAEKNPLVHTLCAPETIP